MKEQTRRSKRMASLIRAEIARTLIEEAGDPRVQTVGITEVKITNDLLQARIFYQTHGNPKEVLQGLKRCSPFLRRKLGQALATKHVPELVFELDTRPQELHHLMQVIDGLGPTGISASVAE